MSDMAEQQQGFDPFEGVEFAPPSATFSQLSNDLFWKFYAGADGFVRWDGYNDRNWWDNVAPTARARTRVGKETGRTFVLDFSTGLVTIEPAQVAA